MTKRQSYAKEFKIEAVRLSRGVREKWDVDISRIRNPAKSALQMAKGTGIQR
ncbi:MAG: hypothetical protein ACJAYC_001378 [Halieaceae bacterium]|jgi:hypothetical protein